MRRIIRVLVSLWNIWKKPELAKIPLPPPGAVVGAVMAYPTFDYDHETFDPRHEGLSIYDYLNARARDGWRLHTIERHSFNDHYQYSLTWERLKQRRNHEV